MSSAAHDLHKAIARGQPSLTQLLRQTKWIAARLRLAEVEEWVGLELAGYAKGTETPAHRKVTTRSLEIYNDYRSGWQFAGRLNYTLEALQPIAEIEDFSRQDRVTFPVAKNFSIKNEFGDSFGSDWPQRFVVAGSQFKHIVSAVAERWVAELETRGLKVFDLQQLTTALAGLAGRPASRKAPEQ